MADTTCHAVERPHDDDIAAMAAGVREQLIQAGAARLRPADPVGELGDDFEPPLLGEGSQIVKLALGMLVASADPCVNRGPLHQHAPRAMRLSSRAASWSCT